jgi:tetratricopeptide (TPR) repeat protein
MKPLLLFCLILLGAAPEPKSRFQEALAQYQFVADFSDKPETRPLPPGDIFWKYPFTMPKSVFPLEQDFGDIPTELVATQGTDMPILHMNRGRELFIKKNYEEARKTWLSGRARYGKDYPYHRRNDYFIALGFLKQAQNNDRLHGGDSKEESIRFAYANSAAFFNWAFLVKKDIPDPFLDPLTPKALYHLGAIYYRFERYNAAHSAVEAGLDYLRSSQGSTAYRPALRRLLAETWIRNRSYQRAMEDLDLLIRQDPNPQETARALARAGDIYFDLNNYELAKDLYELAIQVGEEAKVPMDRSWIFLGECYFWMNQFGKSRTAFEVGLLAIMRQNRTEDQNLAAWAHLRLGDLFLVEGKKDGALLKYYEMAHTFPKHEGRFIAQVRKACLELPTDQGKNIHHSRDILEASKSWPIPPKVQELALACRTLSYAERDKNKSMLDEIKGFADLYPDSEFLQQFAEPLRRYQATGLDPYLKESDDLKAVQFYETHKERLFQADLTAEQKLGLFRAYIHLNETEKALPFWVPRNFTTLTLPELLDEAIFFSEQPGVQGEGDLIQILEKTQTWKGLSDEQIWETSIRILTAPGGVAHLGWLYSLIKTLPPNLEVSCRLLHPILSKRTDGGVWKDLEDHIHGIFPKILKENKECGGAFLDLEARLAPKNPEAFGALWLKRLKWPRSFRTVQSMGLAAQLLSQAGKVQDAKDLWIFLRDQVEDIYPEKKQARVSLDQDTTELEKFWSR